jgi:hypothetical protein
MTYYFFVILPAKNLAAQSRSDRSTPLADSGVGNAENHDHTRRPADRGIRKFREERGYANRSEAVRDLIRERLDAERLEKSASGDCLASLIYV